MRIKQLYIFLFFIWFGSTIIASTTDKADSWTKEKESIVHEVISTFHNSLGFDYLTRENLICSFYKLLYTLVLCVHYPSKICRNLCFHLKQIKKKQYIYKLSL